MGSYGHACNQQYKSSEYVIHWRVGYRRPGKREKESRWFHRVVDEAAARRFCKRWRVHFPEEQAA